MAPVKYALFIEPVGPLLNILQDAKRRVEAWRPGQVYCSHPPHCTLLFGSFSPPGDWMPLLGERVRKSSPLRLKIKEWLVFHNDMQAGGGQTVTLAAEPSQEIFHLQMECATVLGPHRLSLENPWKTEPFASSQDRFGFPFVGQHWKPHFTVASLGVDADDPYINQLTARPVEVYEEVSRIGVWQIQGEMHTRITSLPLRSVA